MTDDPTTRDLPFDSTSGDLAAMHALYTEHQRRVFSIALNYFGGKRDIAEDVTQKVFLKILRKLDFRGDAAFTTWLYRVTVNACVDESKERHRFLNLSEFFGLATPKVQQVQQLMVEREDIAIVVQRAIAHLRPRYRLPIILKYVEGLSYKEIAAVLECSTGTVSSRLHRGHMILAGKLAHLRSGGTR